MHQFCSFFIAIVTVAFTVYSQENSRINIAVNDLQGQGVEQSTAGILSERLRAELINSSVFRVMERAQMEGILKEQGFQKSGACNDNECLVEVGQLLGVTQIIAGSVGKIDQLYSVSVRMIDVATGELLFAVSIDCECPVIGLVSQSIPELAKNIVEKELQRHLDLKIATSFGDLYISSSPEGGSISIDGRQFEQVTPATIKHFPAGDHEVTVQKEGLVSRRSIALAPDDLLRVTLKLEPGAAVLKVFSEPAGASITIDGKEAGATPVKLDKLSSGRHTVNLVKNGYLAQTTEVNLGLNSTEELNVSLRPAATLFLSAIPESAVIKVNGNIIGTGSFPLRIEAGEAAIEVSASDYETFSEKHSLKQGQVLKKVIRLNSSFASLRVFSVPDSAAVHLNGQLAGITPYENVSLKPGNYLLTIQSATYRDSSRQLALGKGAVEKINVSLVHTDEFLKTVRTKKAVTRWITRGVLTAASAGFLCGGIYHNNQYNKNYDAYSSINTPGDLGKAWERVTTSRLRRNLLYAGAGTFTCALAFTFFF